MKVSKKAAACICALMMAASSVTAFTVSAADTETPAASAAQAVTEKAASENVKVGRVTSVDGDRLTIALGEFSGKRSADKTSDGEESSDTAKKTGRTGKNKAQSTDTEDQENTVTDKSKKSRKVKSGETAAAETDGSDNSDENAEKKSGRKHGKGKHHGKFTENGTTETVTLSDDVTVTKKGESAAASEISTGDIVKLKYDENEELTEVKVFSKHKHHAKTEENTETADSGATA